MRKQFKVFLVTLVVVGSRQPRLDLYKMMKSSAMSAYVVGGYMLNDGGLDVWTCRNFMHYRHATIGHVGRDRSPSLMRL